MRAIFKREITSFLTSTSGYLVMGLFLVLNGLFLWVFKGPYNLFEYGFADLTAFFMLAPWIFLFLIPAIAMKSFSEEKKLGTLELLLIKPMTLTRLVLGKFFGILGLALITILPTLLYVLCISELGTITGNLDMGLVTGSYIGILLLVGTYSAIGIYASTLSENQIVAFLLALLLCFIGYYGFEAISTTIADGSTALMISHLGMKAHFEGIGRGVLDTRDLVYFLSITIFFLFLTTLQLKLRSN
jgi:ABC-2 type transport system permease protein